MSETLHRKGIFDTVRELLVRGFKRPEIEALGSTIDGAINGKEFPPQDRVPCVPSRRIPTQISPAGIALIKQFEGCARLRSDGLIEAYPDPGTGGAPWTIGWGSTGSGIGPGTVWTQEQCDNRFEHDLERYAADVSRALGGSPTTQTQFDALVSFHYNTGAIARATLTRKHRDGDYRGALQEFARWNRAGGRVLKGLVRRRKAEAETYASSMA